MNFKSILAVGAHADDIDLSCFGFLLKQQKLGSKINSFVICPDPVVDNPITEQRTQEAYDSLSLIPNNNIIIDNKHVLSMQDYPELTDKIRKIVIDNDVDLVVTHSNDDTMQDHRLIHEVTLTGLRRLPVSIFTFSSISVKHGFKPTILIDIKDEYDTKIKAINKHLSQFPKGYMTEDYARIFNQDWNAKMMGIEYCEKFEIFRMVM